MCKIHHGECEQLGDNHIGETVWNTVGYLLVGT